MKFAKGHGTENDFVIIEDHEGTLEPVSYTHLTLPTILRV